MANKYKVQFLDSDGKLNRATITGNSESDVENTLISNGSDLLSIQMEKKSVLSIELGEQVKLQDKTNFFQQLQTMLSSGVALLNAIEIISKQIKNSVFKEAVEDVILSLQQGSSFSESLKKHPKIFDNITVAMVEAGEKGGILDAMLEELVKSLKQDVEIEDNVKKATRYPKIVGSIMVIAMYVVMTKVIPTFTGILVNSGTEIPALTQGILNFSDFLSSNSLSLLIVGALLFGFTYFYKKTDSGKTFFDKLSLKNPIYKKITIASINLRITKILGTLLKFGVPLKESLLVVRNVADNSIYLNAIDTIVKDIETGKSVTMSMNESGVFSDYLCSMVGVGEEIGALDKMLLSASDYYEIELNNATDGLSASIEPIITVVMGLFIAMFVGSVFMPMFKMYENISM
ncbi:MAG: type II secretion system F family protein [Candidatus Marinimicrobia bacterium]|nr:type II secretion system F family protein [Candidatus Neomarinimicrobiota bacterium]